MLITIAQYQTAPRKSFSLRLLTFARFIYDLITSLSNTESVGVSATAAISHSTSALSLPLVPRFMAVTIIFFRIIFIVLFVLCCYYCSY